MTTPTLTMRGSHAEAADRYRSAVSDVADVLALAAEACEAPMAALKIIGVDGVRFAATLGLAEALDAPRSQSLCDLVSTADRAMVIADASRDARLAAHPLVTVAGVRFVAAVPLHHDGFIVGALCVFDSAPRRMDGATTSRLLERIARRLDTETGLRHRLSRQLFPADADLDDIATTISHEIRTPLASIRGNLEILTDLPGAIAPQYARHIDAVTRNADRLGRTVDNLLRAFDQQRHEPFGVVDAVDLGAVVEAAAEATGRAAGRVTVTAPPEPVLVMADRRLLEIAVGHLLSNALNFGDPDRPVAVSLAGGARASLEIHDHGPGLDEDELSRLGTPFFRGRGARRGEAPGLGLGAAIGRQIIEAQGGVLQMTNAPGAGLTARVTLPAVLQ